MLKMVAGDPPNALLVVGLSFYNLDTLMANPNDTYIRVKKAETGLPLDVIIASGDSFHAKGSEGTQEVFIISFNMDELKILRQKPGKSIIDFDKNTYRLPMNICIFSGTTEAEMATQCADLIGPQTKVTTSARLKN